METQPQPVQERRPISRVWLLYGVYLVLLGWLAFGSHAPDVEATLASLGLRQLREDRYVVRDAWFGRDWGEHVEVARSYVPNYGGVLLYAVGGGLVAYYFNTRPPQQTNEDEEA